MAHVAQLVEHSHGKGKVTGSNPVAGSKNKINVKAKGDQIMAKNKVITSLSCEDCKHRNYSQLVSKQRTVGSLRLKKYCAWCRKHIFHKETK